MPTWLTISIALAVFPFCLAAETRIVFLGDSLTAGYGLDPEVAFPAQVEAALGKRGKQVRSVNAGVSGDTSAGGLRRLDWILRQPVDILVIALGANDALRGQPPEVTRENLRRIIDQARQRYPDIRILLAGMKAPPNMGAEYRTAFDQLFVELAESEQVALMPFLLQEVAGEPSLNLADGIHPNIEGQKIIARNLLPHLLKLLPPDTGGSGAAP